MKGKEARWYINSNNSWALVRVFTLGFDEIWIWGEILLKMESPGRTNDSSHPSASSASPSCEDRAYLHKVR